MQSNSLSKITIVFGALMAALYVVFDLLTSGGNAVAQLYRYLLVGGAIFGLLSPRSGFYLLIALSAYLDFTKRLMIFDSGLSKMDLYYVLGVSPALMCGIAAHTMYNLLISGQGTRPGLTKLAIITLFLAGLFGILGVMTSTNRFQALGDSVNATVYLLLLPVLPMLFRTPEDLRKLLRYVMIIYTPAVIYMLIHWFRASFLDLNPPIFDWELDYVKSGLTIEIRQLAERKFRPFGTFNSASNASMVFAALFGVVASGLWKQPFGNRPNGGSGFWRAVLAVMIILGMFATYSRTGWVFAAILLIAPLCFRNRFTTIAAYVVGGASTLILIAASSYLLKYKILHELTSNLMSASSGSAEMAQVTNIATMDDRLKGFEALMKNRKIWTAFGFKFAYVNSESVRQSIASHDAVTSALMKYGYVPLALGGISALLLLRRMHGYLLAEKLPLARYMASSCLAVGLVLCLGATVSGAQLITYPINFWIWFMFSFVVALMFWRAENPDISMVTVAPGIRNLEHPPVRPARRKLMAGTT